MQLYKEIVDPTKVFEKLSMDHLSEVATSGRSNCMLDTSKLEAEGITMRPIEEALREALEELAKTK